MPRTDEWETPPEIFRELNARHAFTVDAAATQFNALCVDYYSSARRCAFDGLWSGRIFCNPPYRRDLVGRFVKQGIDSVGAGSADVVCFLLPYRPDTRWFAHLYERSHQHNWVVHLEPIMGRIKFLLNGKPQGSPNYPSVIATVFRRIRGGRCSG